MGNKEEIEVVINGTKASSSLKEMSAAISAMNKELKDLPRNSQEFADKKAQLQKVKGEFTAIQKEIKGVQKNQVDLMDTFGAFIPFGGQIQAMRGNFSQWGQGVKGVTQGMRLLKVAIAATGIGVLVVLLGSLISYLTSTQAGMDQVTKVTRPLMAIFEKMKGVVQELGGSVFKGLAQILNGDIQDGLKTLGSGFKDAVSNTSEAITEGYKAGTQLDKLQKQIEKTENNLIVNRARLNAEYNKAKEIAQDQTKSEQERIKAARQAQAAQNELMTMEQHFLDLKIKKMELEHSLNDTSREDQKELAQLIAERTDFEAQAAKKRASARSLEVTAIKQGQAAQAKIQKEAQAAEEAHNKKILAARQQLQQASVQLERSLQDLRVEAMDEGLEKELASLNLGHVRKMSALEAQKDEVLANLALTEQEKVAFLAQFREQQLLLDQERQEAEKEAQEEARQEELETDLENLTEEDELKKARLEEQFMTTMMSEEAHKLALLDLEKATLSAKLALLEEAGQGETLQAQKLKNQMIAIEKERTDLEIEERKKRSDKAKEFAAVGLDIAQQFLDLHAGVIQQRTSEELSALDKRIEYLSQDEEAQQRNAVEIQRLEKEKEKVKRESAQKLFKIQVAQIIADGIKEVASIWAGTATLGPIAGPIVGAIQTGLAIGRSVLAVRKARQQADSYAEGGFTSALNVNGQGHLIDQTGHKVAGVVHEKEWVAPRWMNESPRYANVIGWLESERTRRYADGGMVGPNSQAPIARRSDPNTPAANTSPDLNEFAGQLGQLRNDFNAYASRVDRWASQLRVINDPRDIRDGLNAINKVDADSDIS